MSNYHNLSNEEIIFIYLSNEKFLDQYRFIFKDGGLETITDLPENTYIVNFKQFSEEELLELQQDEHYKYCLKVEEKLAPIVEIIEDSFPDLYDKVVACFKKEKI